MNRAKQLFYACAALLMLAVSFQLGAREASAQLRENSVVQITHDGVDASVGRKTFIAVTAGGDVYTAFGPAGPWTLASNVFTTVTPEERTKQ